MDVRSSMWGGELLGEFKINVCMCVHSVGSSVCHVAGAL